jgi:hypothetical protein
MYVKHDEVVLGFACACERKLIRVVSINAPNPAYTTGTPGSS